jgi:DNA-binding transcriptional MerR regulator
MMQQMNRKGLHAGALAKAAGVSPDTIRHYEKIGVLTRAPRTQGGYRVYPQSAVERVLSVQRALRIGFTLGELAEVLKTRDAGGVPCRRVYEIATGKLERIRTDIQDLQRLEKYLKTVLSDWSRRIRRSRSEQQLHLLHSLTGTAKNSWDRTNKLTRRKKP